MVEADKNIQIKIQAALRTKLTNRTFSESRNLRELKLTKTQMSEISKRLTLSNVSEDKQPLLPKHVPGFSVLPPTDETIEMMIEEQDDCPNYSIG